LSKQIVTINIPDSYLEAIDTLIKFKYYNNRSQIVSIAIEEFLQKEDKFFMAIQPQIFFPLLENNKNSLDKKTVKKNLKQE